MFRRILTSGGMLNGSALRPPAAPLSCSWFARTYAKRRTSPGADRKREKRMQQKEAERRDGSRLRVLSEARAGGGGGGGGDDGDGAAAQRRNKSNEGSSTTAVVQLRGVSKVVDERALFSDVQLSVMQGAKIGILGINGSGKSSLLRILAGEDDAHDGEVWRLPGTSVGFLRQEPELDESLDVYSNVLLALPEGQRRVLSAAHALRLGREEGEEAKEEEKEEEKEEKEKEKEEEKEKEAEGRETAARTLLGGHGLLDLDRRVRQALHALRCPAAGSALAGLSGGERRRVALCRVLIGAPDLLLLDEPTNHLDAASVAWLEHYLGAFGGTCVAVTHDRYFLDNVAGWVLEVDRGALLPFRGNYSEWLRHKARRLDAEDRRQAQLKARIERELAWARQPAKGQQAKGRARVARFEELQRRAAETTKYEIGTIVLPKGPRLGKEVVRAAALRLEAPNPRGPGKNKKDKEDARVLVRDADFVIPPGAVVGVIGPNGTGKTTLLRAIAGEIAVKAGELSVGETVRVGYVSQHRAELDPGASVFEAIAEGQSEVEMPNGRAMAMRAYVSSFHFRGTAQERLVERLSGGERNRVHLARMIKHGCNLLLLDEPTNDLDVEVLRSLEEALVEFPGSAIVVSHDRWFLDRVATHILAFREDCSVELHEGNYREYLRYSKMMGKELKDVDRKLKHRKLGF